MKPTAPACVLVMRSTIRPRYYCTVLGAPHLVINRLYLGLDGPEGHPQTFCWPRPPVDDGICLCRLSLLASHSLLQFIFFPLVLTPSIIFPECRNASTPCLHALHPSSASNLYNLFQQSFRPCPEYLSLSKWRCRRRRYPVFSGFTRVSVLRAGVCLSQQWALPR